MTVMTDLPSWHTAAEGIDDEDGKEGSNLSRQEEALMACNGEEEEEEEDDHDIQ